MYMAARSVDHFEKQVVVRVGADSLCRLSINKLFDFVLFHQRQSCPSKHCFTITLSTTNYTNVSFTHARTTLRRALERVNSNDCFAQRLLSTNCFLLQLQGRRRSVVIVGEAFICILPTASLQLLLSEGTDSVRVPVFGDAYLRRIET